MILCNDVRMMIESHFPLLMIFYAFQELLFHYYFVGDAFHALRLSQFLRDFHDEAGRVLFQLMCSTARLLAVRSCFEGLRLLPARCCRFRPISAFPRVPQVPTGRAVTLAFQDAITTRSFLRFSYGHTDGLLSSIFRRYFQQKLFTMMPSSFSMTCCISLLISLSPACCRHIFCLLEHHPPNIITCNAACHINYHANIMSTTLRGNAHFPSHRNASRFSLSQKCR